MGTNKPQIIAIANNKGGVAKTTTAAAVAQALRLFHKKRVLVVDLDAQGNLSQEFGVTEGGRELYQALTKKQPFKKVSAGGGLVLIPSSTDLLGIELNALPFDTLKGLREEKEFDFVVIDCPPSLGDLTIAALSVSDLVIIPMIADFLSLAGLGNMVQVLEQIKGKVNTNLKFRILITKWKKRRLTSLVEEKVVAAYGKNVLKTKVRENTAISEAVIDKEGLFSYAPKSIGAEDYKAVTNEIIKIK